MLIIASKSGQLGNRLYSFGHFIGCAIENGIGLMNPAFDEYAGFFQGTQHDLLCRFPARNSRLPRGRLTRRLLYQVSYCLAHILARSRIESGRLKAVSIDWEEEVGMSEPTFVEAAQRGLVFVQGWQFRDRRSLKKHAAAIRDFFRPVPALAANVSAVVTSARSRGDVLVGLHVRRGDYRTFMGGRFFYAEATYARVLEKIESLFPGRRVAFLICSNEPTDANTFSRFKYTAGSGHFVEDMYALAGCDYIVGPPSTYTLWASFYGATPLCMIVDSEQAPALEDFHVHGIDNVA